MSEQIWRDCGLWLGGRDLTTNLNSMALEYNAELQDITHFTDTTRRRLGGLKNFTGSYVGFFDAPIPDEDSWSQVGLANVPVTILPATKAAGKVVYFARLAVGTYQVGARIGEVLGIEARFSASGPLVRGLLGLTKASRSVSGNGPGYNLGVVGDNQKLYAAVHIFAVSGTSPLLTVRIQSDDSSGFSTWINRITIPEQSAIGSAWAETAGPIADNWWRVSFTISGTSPAFEFAVVLGIV